MAACFFMDPFGLKGSITSMIYAISRDVVPTSSPQKTAKVLSAVAMCVSPLVPRPESDSEALDEAPIDTNGVHGTD